MRIYNFTIRGNGVEPEIDVRGAGRTINDGDPTPHVDDGTDFGEQQLSTGGALTQTFVVRNSLNGPLTLGLDAVSISGVNAEDFTVTQQPDVVVNAFSSTSFVVRFRPSTLGVHCASISISNDDDDESPYDFAIAATGIELESNIQGNGNDIVDEDTMPSTTDDTDFGNQRVEFGTVSRTFTIGNSGTGVLATGTLGPDRNTYWWGHYYRCERRRFHRHEATFLVASGWLQYQHV